MSYIQHALFPDEQTRPYSVSFPTTRFQGSKRRLVEWIWTNVCELQFDTVLDVFGGTGVVSHLFKTGGKAVTYNDRLTFNWQIGLALIQNATTVLTPADVSLILKAHPGVAYPDFIQRTFSGIYFTDEENAWLDRVVYNIDHFVDNPSKQALARFALFQACIIKRPYNLFHRANLYMRLARVNRSFGNKTTWDTPFEAHFRAFVEEANAAVFDNHRNNQATCMDALETPVGADLVYIDPPYMSARGIGVDYLDFYHFLEGLVCYANWSDRIDWTTKHRRMIRQQSPWHHAEHITDALEALIARHQKSILVVSYRNDGIPTQDTLVALLRRYKNAVREAEKAQKYVLSAQDSKEILLIAT